MRAPRSTLILRWLPGLAAAAYVATVVALGSQLVRDNDWDTDVSGPLALAERLRGSGAVYIPHYGEWTTFWWLLATRWLPWHAGLWEASGYALALGAAVLLGWGTARVAGTWAGITATAIAIVVGPFALRAFLSLASHVTNSVGAIVLATVLVLLTRPRSWWLVVPVGIVAGANAASDPLLWFAGVAPFALASGLLVWTTTRRDVALRAAAALGVTVVAAATTSVVMHALGFHVTGLDLGVSSPHDWPAHVRHLGRMIALLGGANYALPGPYPPEPLRIVVALLTFAGVVTPLVAAVALRRADTTARVYAAFWAAAVVLLCAVFVVTPNAAALGGKSVNYLLTFAPAAGAGVALVAARSLRAQLVVALAVAVVAGVNVASIADGRAQVTGLPAIETHASAIRDLLEREGVTRGYAGYWDAQNLSWQTDMHLLVAPVVNCGAQLCPYRFFTVESWYVPRGGPTFLLVDPTNAVIQAPTFVSRASSAHRFGPLAVYVFDYDIARHIRVIAPS
jgi:hypothetical protein